MLEGVVLVVVVVVVVLVVMVVLVEVARIWGYSKNKFQKIMENEQDKPWIT